MNEFKLFSVITCGYQLRMTRYDTCTYSSLFEVSQKKEQDSRTPTAVTSQLPPLFKTVRQPPLQALGPVLMATAQQQPGGGGGGGYSH